MHYISATDKILYLLPGWGRSTDKNINKVLLLIQDFLRCKILNNLIYSILLINASFAMSFHLVYVLKVWDLMEKETE